MIKESKITKEMKVGDVLAKFPKTATIFFKHGFHCVGCPAANYESIEQGAMIHSIDLDKLINELNEAIKNEQ